MSVVWDMGPGPRALGPGGPFNTLRLIGELRSHSKFFAFSFIGFLAFSFMGFFVFSFIGCFQFSWSGTWAQGLGPWDPGVH